MDISAVMAIGLGVDNLASCITTLGTSFILDGRRLKSINQGWNKEKTRLQSIADKQGMNGLLSVAAAGSFCRKYCRYAGSVNTGM